MCVFFYSTQDVIMFYSTYVYYAMFYQETIFVLNIEKRSLKIHFVQNHIQKLTTKRMILCYCRRFKTIMKKVRTDEEVSRHTIHKKTKTKQKQKQKNKKENKKQKTKNHFVAKDVVPCLSLIRNQIRYKLI